LETARRQFCDIKGHVGGFEMHIGTAILIVGILFLLVASPGFRLAVLIAVGVAVLGFYALVIQPSERNAEQRRQQANAIPALPVISANDIALSDVILKASSQNMLLSRPISYEWWWFDGTVANNSSLDLYSLKFEVTVRDGSRVIAKETVWSCQRDGYTVPAGQARAFRSCDMHFKDMPASESPVASARMIGINGHAVERGPVYELLTKFEQEQRERRARDVESAEIRPMVQPPPQQEAQQESAAGKRRRLGAPEEPDGADRRRSRMA